jgi:hypothetical protein
VSVLYVYDSSAGSKRAKFERILFNNEDLGVAMKVFRKVGIDVAKDQVARDSFGQKVPSFVTFNAKGEKSGELNMAGYKAKAGDVLKLLGKASKGHGKMPLKTFVKKYRSFLNELDQIEGKKSTTAQKRARLESSGKTAKLAKVAKEEKANAKREAKILDGERKLLAAVKAFDADPEAKKAAGGRRPQPSPPAGGG